MSHELIGLLGLSVTLLGTVLVSTWRFSALASKLLSAVQNLEKKDSELEQRLKALDSLPLLVQRVEHVERNHSLIPKLEARVIVVEQAVQFSKELRAQRRGSRPNINGNGDDE